MKRVLRVGIIGASAERGWAKESHVPAVQGLPGLELAAVATGSQSTAEAAAKAYGVKTGYGRAEELIRDPNIDIVAIAVKVPDHRELVLTAIEAGKHIYCEWPLGRNVAESEEMSRAAESAGVHAAIGLQTRASAAAHRARDLVRSGALGRLLSARMYSATIAFARKVEAADAYLDDAANGATLVTIHGGHALDLAIDIAGELEEVSALATTQYPEIEITGSEERRTRSIPDHLLVQSRVAGGAALSVEVAGGRPAEATRFRLELVGDKGGLALDGGAPRGFQSARLRLSVNGEPQQVDEGETQSMPDTAANVAALYAYLRDDVLNGAWAAPGFAHAVRLTKILDDLILSARSGSRNQKRVG